MNEKQLLYHSMNSDEQKKWNELTKKIIEDYAAIAESAVAYSIAWQQALEVFLEAKKPWTNKGYVENEGFYWVEDADRGRIAVFFSKLEFSEARNKLVIRAAHDIIYKYVLDNKKKIQDENMGKWRYQRIEDGIVNENGISRMLSHIEEQPAWEYDSEYDYRIYWFEPMLFIIKRLVNSTDYYVQVAYYEACMNARKNGNSGNITPALKNFSLSRRSNSR